MSRFFPFPEYTEEQPLARTILITHVLHRGFTSGAIVGSVIAVPTFLYQRRAFARSSLPSTAPVSAGSTSTLKSATSTALIRPVFARTLLRYAGVGAVVSTAASGVAMYVRMQGREEIEWKDRSWRLLANEGQVLVDDFSLAGAAVGALAGLGPSAMPGLGWVGVAGRAGLGSMAGTVLYMVYQYGFRRGEEAVKQK